ncbi:hypothetical protein BO85DRAFT_445032 [Aspergillus piperis CBS 112811]|uniref:Uncharacterized protein n=1 Tax=Aspergillus piperis CBS 112811 TaxID=1448313 RepID=A0A8G1RBB0_9EURO|nr:hypothetical protein BO85DRAFT_445032 [Aspergillus piperis CBS 112811]RAH61589.1 hypothetical protein BO85DRAFT_445032 [Aspergillus piperis CBS 112811]
MYSPQEGKKQSCNIPKPGMSHNNDQDKQARKIKRRNKERNDSTRPDPSVIQANLAAVSQITHYTITIMITAKLLFVWCWWLLSIHFYPRPKVYYCFSSIYLQVA